MRAGPPVIASEQKVSQQLSTFRHFLQYLRPYRRKMPIAQGYKQWLHQSTLRKLVGRPIQFIQRVLKHKRQFKRYLYLRDNGDRLFTNETNPQIGVKSLPTLIDKSSSPLATRSCVSVEELFHV